MAKDGIGNEMHPGDKVFFNGIIYTIKEINQNRVIGGKVLTGRNVTGIKIPDSIVLEAELPCDFDKPFNGFVIKTPPELQTNDPKPN